MSWRQPSHGGGLALGERTDFSATRLNGGGKQAGHPICKSQGSGRKVSLWKSRPPVRSARCTLHALHSEPVPASSLSCHVRQPAHHPACCSFIEDRFKRWGWYPEWIHILRIDPDRWERGAV